MIDKVNALYAKMGFKSLDRHISDTLAQNQANPAMPDPFRRLGATTWMCARASIDLVEGEDNVILEIPEAHVDPTFDCMIDILDRGWAKHYLAQERRIVLADGVSQGLHVLYVDTEEKGLRKIRGIRFSEADFVARIRRRIAGPLEMIREIRRVKHLKHHRYLAYAEDDEFIMELAEDAIPDFWGITGIHYVGFSNALLAQLECGAPPFHKPIGGPSAPLPPLPGPFSMSKTVVGGWSKRWRPYVFRGKRKRA